MPIDTYAEASFFKSASYMDQFVQRNVADIILMGIKPSYPSSKYGYIVPQNTKNENGIICVDKFIEKPSENHAKELIASGAFWNGGVFAFKLCVILDVIKRYTDAQTYTQLVNNYRCLNKNSFDYEILEKSSSLGVVPYYGEWKDIGTWNTLTDVMPEYYAGNVVVGEEMSNCHIINELGIPLIALGIHDIVIAATPDGILIANKDASTKIKKYTCEIK